jgi:hypothetical protein
MKKLTRLLMIIIFPLLSNAQSIYITNGNMTVWPNTSGFLNFGQLHINSSAPYRHSVTISGTQFIQSIGYSVDGISWTPGSYSTFTSGTHQWNTLGYVPANTACGLSETFTHNFYDIWNNLIYSSSYTISTPMTPVLIISGAASLCGINSATYTVNGNTGSNGTYTWSSSNSTWKINGQNFPLTTSSASAVINASTAGTSTTITVTPSGFTGICGQLNVPTKAISSVNSTVTLSGPDCVPPHTSQTLTATAGGSSYTWQSSSDNIQWLTMPQTTSTISVLIQAPGSYYFRVQRTYNGCLSNWSNWTIFCTTSGAGCRGASPNGVSMSDFLDIYPNPSNGDFNLKTDWFESAFDLKVYDMLGRIMDEKLQVKPEPSNRSISFGNNFPKGVYMVELIYEGQKMQKKIVKAE